MTSESLRILRRDLIGETDAVADLPEIVVPDRCEHTQLGRMLAVLVVDLDAAVDRQGVLDPRSTSTVPGTSPTFSRGVTMKSGL